MAAAVIEVRDVTKAFGEREVLHGVYFDVAEHEAVALIGASGSGKSTLLRCIDLLEEIDDGDIFLDGEVSATPGMVAQHKGAIFLGGDEAAARTVEPIAKQCIDACAYFGPFGSATKAKLVNNLLVGLNIAGTAQAPAPTRWVNRGPTGFGARLLAELAVAFRPTH